jgi:hypothetical protein
MPMLKEVKGNHQQWVAPNFPISGECKQSTLSFHSDILATLFKHPRVVVSFYYPFSTYLALLQLAARLISYNWRQ